jgi:iron-sulfur cluster assembly accessory protein
LNDTLIVTKNCVKRIQQLKERANNKNLYLRLTVEGGGCSGFQYIFKMDDSQISGEDDNVFAKEDANVVVDHSSYELVKGATIDFVQEMIRSSFAVVNNPQSESACGCGSSFAVKNFANNPALD